MKAVEWADGTLRILDQTRLPHQEVVIEARTAREVAAAIGRMSVRGAPLLGIAAAYGMVLSASGDSRAGWEGRMDALERAGAELIASRPTAVNVAWAVGRTLDAARSAADRCPAALPAAVLHEAQRIEREDEVSCLAIARLGADLLPGSGNVLTHCNTGALATAGCGTALGMIVAAHEAGKHLHVWVDETRPVLQGARLTAWELQRAEVPMTLVADSAAGSLMARGLVDAVAVGADRIAANGDTANKVGTYVLAVLAGHHGIPFYVAAPLSTVDVTTATGADIVIEERDPAEVLAPGGTPFAPAGTRVANPAFDVTPASMITAIVTDRGVATPPLGAALRTLLGAPAPRQAVSP
jgi:methylthioribose-1-phosphate isomerase